MPSWTYCWSNGTSIRMEIRGKDWAPCVLHFEVAQSRRKWPRSMWLPISDPQGPSLTFSDINGPVGPVYFDSRITPYRLYLLCFTAGCVETKWFKFESWSPVYGSTLPTSTASQWLVEYRKMLCDGYNYNVASPTLRWLAFLICSWCGENDLMHNVLCHLTMKYGHATSAYGMKRLVFFFIFCTVTKLDVFCQFLIKWGVYAYLFAWCFSLLGSVYVYVSALVANKHFILQVCYPVRRGWLSTLQWQTAVPIISSVIEF